MDLTASKLDVIEEEISDLKDRWEGNTQQVMKNNRKKIIWRERRYSTEANIYLSGVSGGGGRVPKQCLKK